MSLAVRSPILGEARLTLTQLAHREGVNPATIWRWRTKGVRGAKLESVAIGGRWFTSDEAFARFVEATTGAAPPVSQAPPPAKRSKRGSDASARLAKAGF